MSIVKIDPPDYVSPDVFQDRILSYRQEFFMDLGNLFNLVTNVINNIVALRTIFVLSDQHDVTIRQIQKAYKEVEKKLEKVHFLTLESSLFPCPDGFKGDMPGYVSLLSAEFKPLVADAEKSFADFMVILTEFLNQSSSRQNVKNYAKEIAALRKKREAFQKKVDAFFASHSNQRQKFSVLFDSKSVVIPCFKQIGELYGQVVKKDPVSYKKQIDEMTKRVNLLIDMQQKMSKEEQQAARLAFVAIAEYTYEVASQFEHLAKYFARVEITAVSCKNMLDRMNEII